MRSLFFSSLFLTVLVAQTYALPMELHTLGRRDAVCALNLRHTLAPENCLKDHKGTFFTLTPPSTITAAQVTEKPQGGQCDHIVELQLLDSALKNAGVCDLITKMLKAQKSISKDKPSSLNAGSSASKPKPKTQTKPKQQLSRAESSKLKAGPPVTKATLLQPLSDIINDAKNLNFLASSVNGRKKSFVQNSLSGNPIGNDDLNKAVNNYLQLTKATSTAIAKSLDEEVEKIIKHAQAIADALLDDSGKNRNVITTKAELSKAIAEATKSKSPVNTALQKVLGAVSHA